MNSPAKRFYAFTAKDIGDAGSDRDDGGAFGDPLMLPAFAVHPIETRISAAGNDDGSFPLADPTMASASSADAAVNNAAKPVATVTQLANYLITGFWQYNNTIAHHWAAATISYNINGLTPIEQFLAQSALNAWHQVANVSFVQTTGAANITFNHNGSMTAFETDNYSGAGIINSATIDISADWITSDGGAYDGKTGIDSYSYQTYIHEIGHALGLGHQGPYNGSASYVTGAIYANDTWQYSIMSYFQQSFYAGSSTRYVITPQMADIAAVAAIYGAATTRTGDTVYGFHNTGGSIYDFTAYNQAPALTIYDSGGSDTLDCSGYTAAQLIDLRPGAFSSVGGLTNNIGIATSTVIETGIGGSGNDTMIANDLGCMLIGNAGSDTLTGGSGNDRLVGGTGVDLLTGGGGTDTFVFITGDSSAASGQHDRIADFIAGTDRIDLTGIDAITATAGYDLFRFIGTVAFDGVAGALNYLFDGARGVTVLEGDTNGDRIADFAIDLTGNLVIGPSDLAGISLATTVIEASGSTSLTRIGSFFYLYSGGAGPLLKQSGAGVAAAQFGGWAPIAAEQISGGYEVAWKMAGLDQYTVWTTDSSGNYIWFNGVMSGTNPTFEALETSFHQDLNGDGTTGLAATVIEASGSTSLTQFGMAFYLLASGTGPSLKQNGVDVTQGQFGGWTPIAAEQISGGYEVAWKVAGADQYTIWTTDSGGNYLSFSSIMSGSSATLQGGEARFHQDLNGDGFTGLHDTVIEANGATSLVATGNTFQLLSGGVGPSLKQSGADVTAEQFGGWTPIAAEQISGGYEVAWKMAGADQYTIWTTDSSGNYISFSSVMPGSSTTLQSFEASFHQDLNGDGFTGLHGTVIEANGATSLIAIGNAFYLASGGAGPSLKQSGADVTAGQFGGWTPIAAEQTSSGYQVAWKVAGADQYTIWTTDSNGNYLSFGGTTTGASPTLQAFEPGFHQDLNGDGVTGIFNGGLNNQSFAFRPGIGAEVISDSSSITLDGFAAVSSIQELIAALHEAQAGQPQTLFQSINNGHDTLIDLGHHDSLTLANVHLADLQASHFVIL
jgi:serralysin